MGVALAMISMLTMLPALLTICGRKLVLAARSRTSARPASTRRTASGAASATASTARPRAVWVTGTVVLLLLAANLVNLDTGLTSGNSFRGEVESVEGQKIVARNFPAGSSAPTDVIVPDAAKAPGRGRRADGAARTRQPGLAARRGPAGRAADRRAAGRPVRDDRRSTRCPTLRAVAKRAGGAGVLVGGPTAQEYDLRQSAARDNRVIIPITLFVVFLILVAAAARAARAAAARPDGDPVVRRRARRRRVRLRRDLRLPGHRPVAAAARASSSSSRWGSTTTSS